MAEDQTPCPGRHSTERPAPGLRNDEYLCKDCVHRACRQLRHLREDIDEIDTTIARLGATSNIIGHHRSKGDEPPLPFSEKASETRVEMLQRLREWAEFVACLEPLPASLRGTDIDIEQSLGALLAHVDWMRSNEQGPALADAIGYVRGKLRSKVDRKEQRWFAGPCGRKILVLDLEVDDDGNIVTSTRETKCDEALHAMPGATVIVCESCSTEHSIGSRREYLIESVRDQLLPLNLILSALPTLIGANPNRKTVNQWSSRKLLTPREIPGVRGKVYRAGDIIDLAMPTKPRRRRTRKVSTERNTA